MYILGKITIAISILLHDEDGCTASRDNVIWKYTELVITGKDLIVFLLLATAITMATTAWAQHAHKTYQLCTLNEIQEHK